jgi:hypothetical protein
VKHHSCIWLQNGASKRAFAGFLIHRNALLLDLVKESQQSLVNYAEGGTPWH